MLFNENLLPYLTLSKHIFGDPSISAGYTTQAHVPEKLFLTYFGLCALAVGSIVYQMFCPLPIKQAANGTDYVAATKHHMGDAMFGRVEASLRVDPVSSEELSLLQTKVQGAINQRRGSQSKMDEILRAKEASSLHIPLPSLGDINAEVSELKEGYSRDILELQFRSANQRWPYARLTTIIFYVIGFGLLSIPSLQVFCRVAIVAFGSFI